jgi:hypothetical protein
MDAIEFRRAVLEKLGLGDDATLEDALAKLDAIGFEPEVDPENGDPLPGKPGYDALRAEAVRRIVARTVPAVMPTATALTPRERRMLAELGCDESAYLRLRAQHGTSKRAGR